MKKFKHLICSLLVCAILLGGGAPLARAATTFPSETNPFGENFYVEQTNQSAPFFEKILPQIKKTIKENNKHSISPYFDTLPVANNPENFQGLGKSTYANINGKTVTAEAFYRVKTDSLHDPNAGMGLLIYQCIQYKLAHPEKEVEINFSTYRTSVTAAVCVLPQSKYYGYMRSLYTTNYDEHGFVRISYMLTEAARMGIKVMLINQLPTYSVKQYNPKTKSLESRKQINYVNYFAAAAATDCYNKYAPGKKVSDYLDCVKVGWTVGDQSGNMQHVKTCTVTHYLATDGTEHDYGVFFTTANLDENDYLGRNGNGWSQTGVILSDHKDIYRVTCNYMKLMRQYTHQEGLQEFRKIVADMNAQQHALLLAGKGAKIPANQQILYLGTKNDPVFQLHFTPLAGPVDSWDLKYNPICQQVSKLTQSENYVEFAWNEYGFESNYMGATIGKLLENYYCSNPNPQNKISISVDDLKIDKIKDLELGTEIGYRRIKSGKYMHAKDFLLSYDEHGTRHNVSIMTSCNYVTLAFHYRTNSILVIDETAETGGDFYRILGKKYANDMLKEPESQPKPEKTLIDSAKKFKDVSKKAWYKPYVDYAVTHGIFNGTSKNTFNPESNLTRAQFVQVFANISGINTSNNQVKSGFKDVKKGQWYTAAVTWAAKASIVKGVGDNKFAPNTQVTREQMCVILVNYTEAYRKQTLSATKTVKKFKDHKKISSWASDAVYKCAKAGLVNGVGDNKFDPKSPATRAQGATILTNFHKAYMR